MHILFYFQKQLILIMFLKFFFNLTVIPATERPYLINSYPRVLLPMESPPHRFYKLRAKSLRPTFHLLVFIFEK